ncbi:hypothetical protein BGZ63DRAFT_400598 [Mariannaea sp. PMI_226]|nr:hypothetical protein BGZ63DRAFT_400598 [Mariannaea sp. PMI_226]
MAARAMTAHGPDMRQGAATPTSLSYRPIAGSPTLTNPDMILPDYDRADSPSDERSQSPVMLWTNPQIGEMQFHLPPPQTNYMAGTTPIIYGNGTMLSDIGEVTEVESVIGRGPRRPSSHMSVQSEEDALRSSIKMGMPRVRNKTLLIPRGRRASLESNSTIATQGQNGEFVDFDGGVDADDLDFQGDDEESMASSYVEGTPAHEPAARRRPIRPPPPPEDRFSTTSLSDRAEQILANAKKRLSTMEGNLSRARNTVYLPPMSDGSTPSPPIVRPASSFRETTGSIPAGHGRMSSDLSLQHDATSAGYPLRSASALGAAGGYRQPLTSSRSVDALGGYSAYSPRSPHYPLDATLEPLSEDEDHTNEENGADQFGHFRTPTFGSITDKEVTRSLSVAQVRDLKDQMNDLKGKISSLKEQARADSLKRRSLQSLRTPSPFTHARWEPGFMEPRGIRGAGTDGVSWQAPWNTGQVPADFEVEKPIPSYEEVAAAEIRAEEEEAMAIETKGFSDGVAEQDAEDESDSAKTEHAEQYQPSAEQVELAQEELRVNGDQPPVEELVLAKDELEWQETTTPAEELVYDVEQEEDSADAFDEEVEQQMDEEQEEELEEGHQEEDGDEGDFVDFESESGESLYHDTFQHPVSHEDREDAFDYEHFFLHSAMGTISQQRLGRRGSLGSVSSDDSVETTRGPTMGRRRPSIDTMSSVNTFATATEGRTSRTSTMESETKETVIEVQNVSENFDDHHFDGPPSSKRTTFGGFDYAQPEESNEAQRNNHRRSTIVHRPTHSESLSSLRPSISSFESTGTNRSFPLVNKAKVNGGVLTPSGSPDRELDQISETLMNSTVSICEQESGGGGEGQTPALHLLSREDQVLVQKLVASLGKCVLSLTEVSKASVESRMHRRRIEAARRILDGLED